MLNEANHMPTPTEMVLEKLRMHLDRNDVRMCRLVLDQFEREQAEARIETPVIDLPLNNVPNLPVRIAESLRKREIRTVQDFVDFYNDGTLDKIEQIGSKSIEIVWAAINGLER